MKLLRAKRPALEQQGVLVGFESLGSHVQLLILEAPIVETDAQNACAFYERAFLLKGRNWALSDFRCELFQLGIEVFEALLHVLESIRGLFWGSHNDWESRLLLPLRLRLSA